MSLGERQLSGELCVLREPPPPLPCNDREWLSGGSARAQMGQWASGAAGVLETREATTLVSPLWRQAVALVWREGGVASSAWRRLLASAGRCAWALAHTTGSRCPPPALCPPGWTTTPCRDFVWCRHAVLTGSELGSPLCCHGHGTLWFKGFSHPPPHSAPPEPCEVGSAGISMLEMKRPRRDTVGRAD